MKGYQSRIQSVIRQGVRSGELQRIEESWSRGCMVCYIRRRFKGTHPVKLRLPQQVQAWKKVPTSELHSHRRTRRRVSDYEKWSRAWTHAYVELCGRNIFA